MTITSQPAVVELPEPQLQPMLLVERSTGAKKGGRHKREPLEDRLVAGVVAQQVAFGAGGIADPREFPASDFADFEFFLVHIAVTTFETRGEPFIEVRVNVPLHGDGAGEPIAWSMAPDRLVDKIELSREFSINAGLKIVALGSVEGGPEAGWKRGEVIERNEPFLLAGRELTATPTWRLLRTPATGIDGMTRLSLIVRAPAGSTTTGSVELSARVQRERLGVFPYDAELPDRRPLPFTLV